MRASEFEGFYRRWRRYVLTVVGKSVPTSDVDDVMQEVFVKIWRGNFVDNGEASTVSWIGKVAHNAINDYYRRVQRHSGMAELSENIPAQLSEPGDIEWILALLPSSDERGTLRLELDGYSLAEIAELLHVSYEAIRNRHRRGIHNLRSRVEVWQ